MLSINDVEAAAQVCSEWHTVARSEVFCRMYVATSPLQFLPYNVAPWFEILTLRIHNLVSPTLTGDLLGALLSNLMRTGYF